MNLKAFDRLRGFTDYLRNLWHQETYGYSPALCFYYSVRVKVARTCDLTQHTDCNHDITDCVNYLVFDFYVLNLKLGVQKWEEIITLRESKMIFFHKIWQNNFLLYLGSICLCNLKRCFLRHCWWDYELVHLCVKLCVGSSEH